MKYLNPEHLGEDQPEKPLTKTDLENQNQDDCHSKNCCRRAGIFSAILVPFQWLQMLSAGLNPTFVLGIVRVYGHIQGCTGSFFKVVPDYY